MRYNVTFNQLELIRYNENKPIEKQLNIIDAILLQQLFHLSNWDNVETIKLKDGLYFWVAYGKLINELPALGITTNNGLAKRISKNLLKPKLIKRHIQWNDNSKTYWQFTQSGLKIATPGLMEDPTRTERRKPHGRMNENHQDDRTNNYNTNDNKISDKRETLSHLDFLKNKYPIEIDNWIKENGNKIFNKDLFKESFNDAMSEKEIKRDHKLIYTFKKYGRHWIRNQKESERPYVKPVYLRNVE